MQKIPLNGEALPFNLLFNIEKYKTFHVYEKYKYKIVGTDESALDNDQRKILYNDLSDLIINDILSQTDYSVISGEPYNDIKYCQTNIGIFL